MAGEETDGKMDFDIRVGVRLTEKGKGEALQQWEQQ